MDVTRLIYAVHDGYLNSLIDYLDAGEAIDEQALTPLMLTAQKGETKSGKLNAPYERKGG